MRVEVATGKVTEVDVGGRGNGAIRRYLPLAGKVLVAWGKVDSNERTYRLVDAATGVAEVVEGDFGPLFESVYWLRPLQAVGGAGRENEMWVAKSDYDKRETVVGRYDVKKFAFEPVLRLPGLRFASMAMWVDEPAGWVYVAVNGDLLRMAMLR